MDVYLVCMFVKRAVLEDQTARIQVVDELAHDLMIIRDTFQHINRYDRCEEVFRRL